MLSPRADVGLLLTAGLLTALATQVLRDRADALRPPTAEQEVDVPPFPAEVSRPFSFGLRSVVADLTFLEAIQVLGARKGSVSLADGRNADRQLARLLTYTVDLDPGFDGAYRFAGSALPRHTTDGYAAGIIVTEQLLQKGVRERPDDWHIPFLLGFTQSFYLGKFREAASAMAQAAKSKDAPRFVGLLATRLAADAGDLTMAEQMAEAAAAEANEDSTREEWRQRLLDLRMERHLREIEAAAARYRARTGSAAPSVEALVSARDLPAGPAEPHGGHYLLAPNGEAHSSAAPRLRLRGRAGTQSGMIAQ